MKWIKKSDKAVPKDEVATQLTLADRVSRRVIHSSSAREVARGTIQDLEDYMPIEWAALSLIDGNSNQIIVQDLIPIKIEEDEVTVPLEGTAISWVASEKQALLQTDVHNEARFKQTIVTDSDINTIINMPLFYRGDVYGVISIGTNNKTPYSDSQLRLLKHGVAHLAVSVKSALLLEQNLNTEAMLSNINELLAIITSKSEMGDVFTDFAKRLKKVIDLDRLTLYVVEGKILRPLLISEDRESYPSFGDTVLIQDSAIPWMLENRRINFELDMSQKQQFSIDSRHVKDNYRGVIRLPLFSHGDLFASVELLCGSPYTIKGKEEFLRQLAVYLSTPVQSYILYLYERQRIEWLAALAHHLRTPLTPIVASSQMLSGQIAKTDDDKLKKLANNIAVGSENLKDNLKLFWDISEVESASFQLDLDKVDPKAIVETIASDMGSVAAKKSQSIVTDTPESIPEVRIDNARIRQVLVALLENAMETSPEKSQIGIKAGYEKNEVMITVSDSGDALKDDDIASLIQPYSFSESDMKSHPKLTLRLAVCIKIVKLHGGRLWIESKPGIGNNYNVVIAVT